MNQPVLKNIVLSMNLLAEAMDMKPLPVEKAEMLLKHILFNAPWNGVEGKEGWYSSQENLITEYELRDLILAHSATKISHFNNKNEPNCDEYSSKQLISSFEKALFGRPANKLKIESL